VAPVIPDHPRRTSCQIGFEWASYTAEARLTDNVAGEALPGARDEYPEYDQ
jgi:hypothetical protein